jgi:AcrR family transcriptional regulator
MYLCGDILSTKHLLGNEGEEYTMHESIHTLEAVTCPSDDRRHALILAAYQSIAEKGFEGLRTRDVAAQVGIHSATLHHYFPTKEALIQEAVNYAVQRLIQATTPLQGSARQRLSAYLDLLQRQMETEPTLLIVLDEVKLRARRDEALERIAQANQARQRDLLVHLLQDGIKEGSCDQQLDVEATAMAISCFVHGVGLRLPLPPEEIRHVFAQLKHWLGL